MTPLYLRNKNTGEIHRAYRDDKGKFSLEQCNQDDIKEAEEVTEEVYLAAGDDQCGNCKATETPSEPAADDSP